MSKFLETIKILDGEICNLSYHQKRYQEVLNSLGCDEVQDIKDILTPPEWGLHRCRFVYSKDGVVDVEYIPYKKKEVTKLKVVFENNIDYSVKSINREKLISLFNQRDDADDVLIIKNLLVSDTTLANIALFKDGVWHTPKTPLLKGTTRARLLDEGILVESDIKVQDLRKFTKVALLNAMIDFYVLDQCEFLL